MHIGVVPSMMANARHGLATLTWEGMCLASAGVRASHRQSYAPPGGHVPWQGCACSAAWIASNANITSYVCHCLAGGRYDKLVGMLSGKDALAALR